MQVILLETIKNLGDLGSVVDVRPGYGRNFLIPQGKALPATKNNLAEVEERRAELEKQAAELLSAAEARADLAAATVHAYRTGTEVAEFAFRAGGASSLYLDGELQRCHRDLQAGAQHVVASEEGFERAGQVYLGVGTPGFL